MRYIFVLLFLMGCHPAFAQNPGEISTATVFPGISGISTNYIKNPSGFKNSTFGLSVSSGTVARDTDTADRIDGIASLTCDTTAQNGYCRWATNTVRQGDTSGNCQAYAIYKGDASLHKLDILHSTSTVASSQVLSNVSDWGEVSVMYPCSTLGVSVQLRQSESGTSSAVNIGRVSYGKARFPEVSQATQWGKVSSPGTASCGWVNSSPSTTFAGFSADTDCPTATASGYASAPSTKIPAITFASLPKGKYYFVARLTNDYFAVDGAGETDIGGAFRFNDGTNSFGGLNLRCIQASFCSASEFSGEIEYTTDQSNITIQIQGRETLAAVTNLYINNGVTGQTSVFEITAYRYPTQDQIVAKSDNADTDWVSYTPTGSWVSNTSYTGRWRRQGDTMEIQGGWATTGTPTAANLTIDLPSGYTIDTTKLASTSPSADTTSLGTAAMLDNGTAAYTAFANYSDTNSLIIVVTATGGAYGTVAGISSTVPFGWGNNDLGSFIAKVPITGWTNTGNSLLHIGSVTSNSTGLERIERAYITYSGGVPSVSSQSGSWITSITDSSTGNGILNLTGGTYSAGPACTCSVHQGGAERNICMVNTATTSSTVPFFIYNEAGATAIDQNFYIICMGPR